VAGICGNQQLTYRQLNERSTQLANHLQKLGVKPNDLVGICVERSLEMLVGLFGILKAGAGYVPLDPAYPTDRLAFMLEDCKPRLLLTQRKLQKRVPQCQAQIVCLDALVAETTGRECQQRQPHTNWQNDLAYVLYTSGSTGRPKGVQIPHRALVNFLAAMKRKPGISAADTLLAVTTLSFDIAGLELFLPLLAGARVIIASREDVANGATLSSLIKRYGVTVMQATPSTWRLLLAAGWGGDRHLKILCGGEAWSAELAEQLLPRCESLWNMYGPTETTIWSSANRVEAGKPVVIGMPIDNTAFYVLDAFQSLVPVGLPGELYIGGDGIARGYLNQTQLTKQRFIDDPFSRKPEAKLYRTGDIVRRLSDGTIEFLNRIDHQVKIRGFRIELGEVESALKQHSAIAQCVVLARENVPGDKRLAAYVVPHGSKVAPPAQELRDFLKQKLPDYMIPSAFVLLRELPLTPNGKVDRKALPLTPDECSSARQIMPPRTAWEFRLLRIWEQVLRIEIASVRDDFFDLGGHSLLAVELFAQIEKEFRTRLPLSTLYQAPTIEDLARILSGEAESPGWSSIIPIQPFGSRPPFFCFHGAGGNVLIYRKLAKYLGSDQPFYGLQARGLDGQSPPATTIEEMAAEYIKEIRFVQPQGPYFLGGYCMGGTVAYEVAQQLRAAGEEIALLALMDTMNWHKVVLNTWTGVFLRLQRLVFHATVTLKMDFESRRKFLEGKYNDLRNRIPVWRQILLTKMQKHAVRSTPSSFALAQVWQTNDYASRNYVPKSYPGVVTDFRPSRQYRLLNKAGLKWDRLATGGQRVVVVPGYPSFMLHEPYVKVLASMLRTCIDRASRSQKERARPRPELPIVRAS
jgi:amino acid adenylation domain-containing protein